MKTKIKSDHFWERAWERGFNQSDLDGLMENVNRVKSKTVLVFGSEKLRKLGYKFAKKSHLVIVMKSNVLITLFEVSDLYNYLKSISSNCSTIIM
jgi:hypothetical protein